MLTLSTSWEGPKPFHTSIIPGGGEAGGRIVAAGTPEEVAACAESVTGRYIAEELS